MKNLRLYILIALIAVTASVFAIKVNAQANGNTGSTGSYSPFKVLNGVILPQSTAWTLKLPYLGGSGSKLVCVDNNGLVAITGCPSSGGGGSGGGTWATTTSNVSGQLVNYSLNDTDIVAIGNSATTSAEFYFDPNLQYSFLIGTTTHSKAIQIGATAGDHGIFQTVSRTYGASVTTGGAWNLTNTLNDGAGLVLVTAHAGSATGRLFAANCSNAAFDQDCGHIDSAGVGDGFSVTNTNAGTSANAVSLTGIGDYTLRVGYTGSNANKGAAILTNSGAYTTLDVTGQPLGQGVIKCNAGGVADTDASCLSIDASLNSSVMQAIFFKGNATGKLINGRDSANNEVLTMLASGFMGLASSTPGSILAIGTTGGINFTSNATTTYGSGVQGINLTKGCFAIAGTCISGSGGAGTVTGSGSTGKIPKWTSATALGDSIITESAATLTINGDILPQIDGNNAVGIGGQRYSQLYLTGRIDYGTSLAITYNDGGTNIAKFLSNGNFGVGTTTPGSMLSVGDTGGINITNTATSTWGSSVAGINLTKGCFAIAGVCISGSGGGSGTVTSVVAGDGFQNKGLNITSSGTLVAALATATTPTLGQVAYWGGVGDVTNPAKLNSVATSSIASGVGITVTNGSTAFVLGAQPSIACNTASVSVFGCLAASDFSKFNSATTTFSTGLTYTLGTNAVTVNTSQNIATLSNLTTNGYVKTSGGVGTLGVQAVPIPFADGGTGVTSFPINSIITSNASGNGLIATGTQLTVGNLIATTTASSYFLGKLGVGTSDITSVNANAKFTVAGIGSQDIIASTTDNTTTSDAILQAYAPGSRVFVGAHGTNQVSSRYGLTLGGYAEITALDSTFGTVSGLIVGTNTSVPFILGTASQERMRIDGFGYISMGTTTNTRIATQTNASSTASQLSLSAGAGINQWAFRNAGGDLFLATTTVDGTATTTTAAVTFKGNGKPGLAISSSTPNATLTVESRAGNFNNEFFIGSSTELFRIDNTGNLFAKIRSTTGGNYVCVQTTNEITNSGSGTSCTLSTQKAKHNILSIPSALDEIMQLRPVSYTFNDSGEDRYGFIAEEVAKIDPRLVEYAQEDTTVTGQDGKPVVVKKGDPLRVDYEHSTSLLARGIQELAVMKGMARSVEENWQWYAIGFLAFWNILITGYLIKKRK